MGSVGSGQTFDAEHRSMHSSLAPDALVQGARLKMRDRVHTHTTNVRSARNMILMNIGCGWWDATLRESAKRTGSLLVLMIPRDEVYMTYNTQRSEHASTQVYTEIPYGVRSLQGIQWREQTLSSLSFVFGLFLQL